MKNDKEGTLSLICDGFYCKKCNAFHPTVAYHEKFIERFEKSRWIESYISAVERFNGSCTPEQAEEQFYNHLSMCSLNMNPEEKPCTICTHPTYFSNIKTGNRICSQECKYEDNNTKQDG